MRKNEAAWIESRERWQIKVQKDGIRKMFTSTTQGKKGKAEAERAADRWLEEGVADSSIRLKKLYEDFLEEAKLTGGTANYRMHESIGRLWLLPKLGGKRMSAITCQDWQDCINAAYAGGKSKKTCMNIRASITRMAKYARKRKVKMDRPEDLEIPRDAPVGERSILQPNDLKILFSADTIVNRGKTLPAFFVHAYRFLVLTGLRRGELCGLRQDDIKDGILYISRAVNGFGEITGGKNINARRYIALSKHALAELEAHRAMLTASGIIYPEWVFPDEYGGMLLPNHLYNTWTTFRKQHGIKCTLHELRHTLISVAKADVPEQLLKNAVGHSKTMDTFGVYGHDVEGEARRVANILDGIFDLLLE